MNFYILNEIFLKCIYYKMIAFNFFSHNQLLTSTLTTTTKISSFIFLIYNILLLLDIEEKNFYQIPSPLFTQYNNDYSIRFTQLDRVHSFLHASDFSSSSPACILLFRFFLFTSLTYSLEKEWEREREILPNDYLRSVV